MAKIKLSGRSIEYDDEKFVLCEGTEDENVTWQYGTKRLLWVTKGRDFSPPVYLGFREDMDGLILVTKHVFLLHRKDVAAIEIDETL